MNLNPRAQMKLLLVGGTVMLIVTVLIVLYGFRRTEELRTDNELAELALLPKISGFGLPVGLFVGLGETPRLSDSSATFDDGLFVSLVSIEKQQCAECPPDGQPVALLRLTGGTLASGEEALARISATQPQWADRGYVVSLLEIDAAQVAFIVELEGQVNP